MKQKLLQFTAVTLITNIAFHLVVSRWFLDSAGKNSWVFPVCLILSLAYVVFIAGLVHKFSGVPTKKNGKIIEKTKPGDPSRKDQAKMMAYWQAWYINLIVTGVIFVVLFQRDKWQLGLGMLLAASASWVLATFQDRRKISGYKKEELFS